MTTELDVWYRPEGLELGGGAIDLVSEAGKGKIAWRAYAEPDYDLSYEDLEDPEVFGKVHHVGTNSHGQESRPTGFDGSARKIWAGMHDAYAYWYQPPADLVKGDLETLEKHIEYVREVITWGYETIVVKATHATPDGYLKTWGATLGGVEALAGDYAQLDQYKQDIANDLIDEVLAQIGEEIE